MAALTTATATTTTAASTTMDVPTTMNFTTTTDSTTTNDAMTTTAATTTTKTETETEVVAVDEEYEEYPYENDIDFLMGFGIDRETAVKALADAHGNVTEARKLTQERNARLLMKEIGCSYWEAYDTLQMTDWDMIMARDIIISCR
ncbi:hypothetical protein EJ06DRAFT_557960 [Trichodelitschia bisporula]|uniref:UBA domain-containing protein n=1 Tax=Trichodelitschia bisporula TaxID=703511 RepID=A0A6G1HSD6_9PEZI|nr:hypothetical protein EJ06DRAFT_557960 [Trichodelitschia bisporula]